MSHIIEPFLRSCDFASKLVPKHKPATQGLCAAGVQAHFQWAQLPLALTAHTELPTSSAINKAPSAVCVKPTGAPYSSFWFSE